MTSITSNWFTLFADFLNDLIKNPAIILRCCLKKIGKADVGRVVGFVGHGADAEERHFVDLAGVGDGGGFHIYSKGVVNGEELTGFFGAADELIAAYQSPFVNFGGVSVDLV